jgi:hypothetical protein
LSGTGVKHFKEAGYQQAASQALVSRLIKKEQIKVLNPVLIGLQQIYYNRHT